MRGTAPQLPLATKVMGCEGGLADSREQLSVGMQTFPRWEAGPSQWAAGQGPQVAARGPGGWTELWKSAVGPGRSGPAVSSQKVSGLGRKQSADM